MKLRISDYKIIVFVAYLFGVFLIPYLSESPVSSLNKTPKIKFDRVVTGLASWYGVPFHGRLTASGDVYDMHKLTAAHKHLPLDSVVKVTNLANHKSVIVHVNDRGPYVHGRSIDPSYRAAQELGMVHKGVAKVKMEIVTAKQKFQYRGPRYVSNAKLKKQRAL